METKELIFKIPRGHNKYARFDLALVRKHKVILGMLKI